MYFLILLLILPFTAHSSLFQPHKQLLHLATLLTCSPLCILMYSSQRYLLEHCLYLIVQYAHHVQLGLLSQALYITESKQITNSCQLCLVGFEWRWVGACCFLKAFHVASLSHHISHLCSGLPCLICRLLSPLISPHSGLNNGPLLLLLFLTCFLCSQSPMMHPFCLFNL